MDEDERTQTRHPEKVQMENKLRRIWWFLGERFLNFWTKFMEDAQLGLDKSK